MVDRKSWQEFRESGLLWFINTILHMFGWALCLEFDNDQITDAYPARVKFRGFDEQSNTEGYIGVSKYLKNNVDQLLKESQE